MKGFQRISGILSPKNGQFLPGNTPDLVFFAKNSQEPVMAGARQLIIVGPHGTYSIFF